MQGQSDQEYAKAQHAMLNEQQPQYPPQMPPQPPIFDYPPPQYPPQYQQYPQQQQPYYSQQQAYPPQLPQQLPYPQQFPANQLAPIQQGAQPQIIVVQQGQQIQDQSPQIWRNPLCGCMKNCSFCCASFCCWIVLFYNHANAIQQATKGVTSCFQACCLDCFGCSCFNRQAVRKAYNIEGSFCEDCCLSCFCTFCTFMQEIYEVEDRG